MGQSLSSILLHIVFSTKNRAPFIHQELSKPLDKYLCGIARNLDSPILAIGGMPDHLHILVSMARRISVSDLVQNIKQDSSKWMKAQHVSLKGFSWQDGYAAFSIGRSGVAKLKRYIANQETYHKQESFQDELRNFLRKYELEFDEEYLWR